MLEADVYDFNIGSARVLEKSGFRCYGKRELNTRKDGKLLSTFGYELTKEKWSEL